MNSDLNTRLREADPLAVEAELLPEHVEGMRTRVMAARTIAPRRPSLFGHPVLLVAAAALVVVVVALVGSLGQIGPETSPPTPASASARRQIQFETPGGTRIIWSLDPDAKF
jgi:hypothetical protein